MRLRADEDRVARRVVAEEETRRTHVVVYLSGAHAYGFPSPDSDLDLKAIHLAKTEELLGFGTPAATFRSSSAFGLGWPRLGAIACAATPLRRWPGKFDRAEIVDGIEIDYTSNELAHALRGILDGNGNFLERILGATTVHESPILSELRAIAPRALSRRYHRHYHGFATNQRRALERRPTAKALLYVLRTALTGVRLLERAEVETDLRILVEGDELASETAELLARKRAGERTELDQETIARWAPRVDALFARLDAARDASPLPESASAENELERWLVALRAKQLAT